MKNPSRAREQEDPVEHVIPSMPATAPTKWNTLVMGRKFALAFRQGRGNDAFFVSRGLRKPVAEFPLSEEGWRLAWRKFSSLEPRRAIEYVGELQQRAAAPRFTHEAMEPPRPDIKPTGLADAALLLGIIGAACGLVVPLFLIAWILGILALVFGSRAIKHGAPRSVALAGLVLGIVAIVLGIVGVALAFNDGLGSILGCHETRTFVWSGSPCF